MNGYDIVVLLVLAVLAWQGFRRGLVGELVGLLAFFVALGLAFRFDGPVGRFLHHLAGGLSPTAGRIIAFLLIVVLVDVAASILITRLNRLLSRIPVVGTVNRLGGLAVGLVFAVVAIWLVTSAFLLLPAALVPFSATVHHSTTAHVLRRVTPRWRQDLRAYVNHFTRGHLSPSLEKELRALTDGRVLVVPRL